MDPTTLPPLLVYSAILGANGDKVQPVIAPPDPQGRPVRYVMFSDGPLPANTGWEGCLPPWEHNDQPRRTARRLKTCPEYFLPVPLPIYTLWFDGTHQLKVNPWELVDLYLPGETHLATFHHPLRKDFWEEAMACITLNKDRRGLIEAQIARYQATGYKPSSPLPETSVLLRRHVERVVRFDYLWWQEIEAGSCRDQLSVNYAMDRAGVVPGWLPGHRTASPLFNMQVHR